MIDRNNVLNIAHLDTDINEYLMTIYNLVVQGDYKTVVELGSGFSTVALMAGVNKIEGHLDSCDMGDGSINRSGLKDELLKEPRFTFHFMDDMKFRQEWDKPIDFLLFDTSHRYEDTKIEVPAWFPLVRVGGQIFCHDTAHESGDGVGCRIALNEYMNEHKGEYTAVHMLDTKIIGGTVYTHI